MNSLLAKLSPVFSKGEISKTVSSQFVAFKSLRFYNTLMRSSRFILANSFKSGRNESNYLKFNNTIVRGFSTPDPKAILRDRFVKMFAQKSKDYETKLKEKFERKNVVYPVKEGSEMFIVLTATTFPFEIGKLTVFREERPTYAQFLDDFVASGEKYFVISGRNFDNEKSEPYSHGTLVEVKNVFYNGEGKPVSIEYVGRERVEIVNPEIKMLGYWKGKIKYYQDQEPQSPIEKTQLLLMLKLLKMFLLKEFGKEKYEKLVQEGTIPPLSDPVRHSFWVCEMLPNTIQQVEKHKQALLTMRSTGARIKKTLELLSREAVGRHYASVKDKKE